MDDASRPLLFFQEFLPSRCGGAGKKISGPRDGVARRTDGLTAAYGAFAGPGKPLPLVEHEAALFALRRRNDEAPALSRYRPAKVLEMVDDLFFGDMHFR